MDLNRLRQTLGHPDLTRMVDQIYKQLARKDEVSGRVSLGKPEEAERQALSSLMGRSYRGQSRLVVDLQGLEQLLRESHICDNLIEAITELRGPIIDPRQEREAQKQYWTEQFEQARARDPRDVVHAWLDEIARTGLHRRKTEDEYQAAQLLETAVSMAAHLPAENLLLREFAARHTGDAHALDADRSLNTLIGKLVQRMNGNETQGKPDRKDWHAAGLITDALSSHVLVLGLGAKGEGNLDLVLRTTARIGHPCRLTLHQLSQARPTFVGHEQVYICENPAVVQAAAMRLKPGHAPLICTEGEPGDAVHRILYMLRDQDAHLAYHGDFDWGGLSIAGRIMAIHGATPWRFCQKDYLAATTGTPLEGTPTTSYWDPTLSKAMAQRKLAIHEETLIKDLLADLT